MLLRSAVLLAAWGSLVAAAWGLGDRPESLYFLAAAFGGSAVFLLFRSGWRAAIAGMAAFLLFGLTAPGRTPRRYSNERSAMASLQTLALSQEQYRSTEGEGAYGTLADLGNARPPYIDPVLSSGRKGGYSFVLVADGRREFTARAAPIQPGVSGERRFFVDSSGVLRWRSFRPGPAAASDAIVGREDEHLTKKEQASRDRSVRLRVWRESGVFAPVLAATVSFLAVGLLLGTRRRGGRRPRS